MDQAMPRSNPPVMPKKSIGVGKTGLGTIGHTALQLALLRCVCWIRCSHLSIQALIRKLKALLNCHPTKTPIRQSVVDMIIHHHFKVPNAYPTSLQVHVSKATGCNIV